jgi:hypothetical protein
MTPDEQAAAFALERQAQIERMVRQHAEAARQVAEILAAAGQRIEAQLLGKASDFQQFQLPVIRASITRNMAELTRALEALGITDIDEAWSKGVDLLDRPLAAGGVRISAVLPEVDLRQLIAIRSFTVDRMRDVGREAAGRLTTRLGLVIAGEGTPNDAAREIQRTLDTSRSRALTITRTELGRAFSVATHERQTAARAVLPGLRKQWRRSGKVHSRPSHDVADGQLREVDEPFLVGGHRLMYPRDPDAPAAETINCGCVSLPMMESWQVRDPGARPFSVQELAQSSAKRDLDRERS